MKGDFWIVNVALFIVTNVTSMKNPDKTEDTEVDGEKYNPRGTYKTKEEIEKAPAEDHPCNLTRTSVRISFPALKSETFVNLLGYKEPNLVPLWRCKGRCQGGEGATIACIPTRTSNRTVRMMFRTHLTKGDSKELMVGKERMKEVVLEEHLDCGCQCAGVQEARCRGQFNQLTCSCSCDSGRFDEEKTTCEGNQATYWDDRWCQCRSKSVHPRGTEDLQYCRGQGTQGGQYGPAVYDPGESSLVTVVTYVFLGCCLTVAVSLLVTTLHYRRKAARLLEEKETASDILSQPASRELRQPASREQREVWHNSSDLNTGSLGRATRVASRKRCEARRSVDFAVGLGYSEETGGQQYLDQYDSHGVLVQREEGDMV